MKTSMRQTRYIYEHKYIDKNVDTLNSESQIGCDSQLASAVK